MFEELFSLKKSCENKDDEFNVLKEKVIKVIFWNVFCLCIVFINILFCEVGIYGFSWMY